MSIFFAGLFDETPSCCFDFLPLGKMNGLSTVVVFFLTLSLRKKTTTSTLAGAQVRHANNRSGKVNIKKAQKEVHYV